MKLALPALVEAVRVHLSPSLAEALPFAAIALLNVQSAPDQVEDSEFGAMLMRTMWGLGLSSVALAVVHLTVGDDVIQVGPEEVDAHPLLSIVPATLAAALSAPLVSGARGTFAALGAPSFDQIDVVDGGDICVGSLNLRLAGTQGLLGALALYGPLSEVRPYAVTRTFQGRALFEVGRAARQATRGPSTPVVPTPRASTSLAGLAAASSSIN